MKLTYYGHSSLGIEINGKHILVDPFIASNPKASNLDINQIPADYILITHAHYDHVMDVESIAKRTDATIISNHEIAAFYANAGFKSHGMNHGGTWTFDFGKVKAVSAIHSSSFPDGTYGGNPCGFIVSANQKNIYIAGDTALTMDMKLIPMFFKLDLAILPLGGNYTMDIEEAVVAADFVECNQILGVHYDTAEYITIDHQVAKNAFAAKGHTLNLLNIGESIEL